MYIHATFTSLTCCDVAHAVVRLYPQCHNTAHEARLEVREQDFESLSFIIPSLIIVQCFMFVCLFYFRIPIYSKDVK